MLVVDDEPAVREVLERILRHEGYDVALATDGREAIQRQRAAPADAVVLDILMPHIDGMEVCLGAVGARTRGSIAALTCPSSARRSSCAGAVRSPRRERGGAPRRRARTAAELNNP